MKGILFKPDMIKTIAEGRKTVTRRLHNLKSINEYPSEWIFKRSLGDGGDGKYWFQHLPCERYYRLYNTYPKPRYQVGDVVYIKEAWATDDKFHDLTASQIEKTKVATVPLWYKFDDTQLDNPNTTQGYWRSPLFMPAWAARYFIQITDVRPERLQEITLEDCKAEGIQPYLNEDDWEGKIYRQKYAKLWDSINLKYPWASNPWVWVYRFHCQIPLHH